MGFEAPLVLGLLAPLALVAVWLMRRGGAETAVPFVHLWPTDSPATGTTARARTLPLWMWLLLLSAGTAIVCAAGLHVGARWERRFNLVIDRGVTMSAARDDGATALRAAAAELFSQSPSGLSPQSVTVVPPVSSDVNLPAADWPQAIVKLPPSPLPTREAIIGEVQRFLRSSDLPVVVISNQASNAGDPRVVGLAPKPAGGNVGIALFAAVDAPRPQLMVRLLSDVTQSATLHLPPDVKTAARTVSLVANEPQDVFIDLPALPPTVEVAVHAGQNSILADDRAWLVQTASWLRLLVHASVPGELRRLAEVYSKERPTDEGSPAVHIAEQPSDLPGGDVQALFVTTNGRPLGEVTIADVEVLSELGREIDWPAALKDASVGPEPDASWKPLVRVSGKILLAERTAPVRQVLVNFWSESLPQRPEFVVLFGAIFDSFSGGERRWRGEPMIVPPPTWKRITPAVGDYDPSPGVYRDDIGRLHALNVPGVIVATPAADWQRRLEALPRAPAGGVDASRWLAVVALAVAALGLAVRLAGQPRSDMEN